MPVFCGWLTIYSFIVCIITMNRTPYENRRWTIHLVVFGRFPISAENEYDSAGELHYSRFTKKEKPSLPLYELYPEKWTVIKTLCS